MKNNMKRLFTQARYWVSGFSWLALLAIAGVSTAVLVSVLSPNSFDLVVTIFGVSVVSAILSLRE